MTTSAIVEQKIQKHLAIAMACLHHFARATLEGHKRVPERQKPIFHSVRFSIPVQAVAALCIQSHHYPNSCFHEDIACAVCTHV